jgi:hypothetical protein
VGNNILEEALAGDQDVGVFFALDTIMFDEQLPRAGIFLPEGPDDLCVQLDIAVEVPFFHGPCDVLEDLLAAGIEFAPFRIWVERKCLRHARLAT